MNEESGSFRDSCQHVRPAKVESLAGELMGFIRVCLQVVAVSYVA